MVFLVAAALLASAPPGMVPAEIIEQLEDVAAETPLLDRAGLCSDPAQIETEDCAVGVPAIVGWDHSKKEIASLDLVTLASCHSCATATLVRGPWSRLQARPKGQKLNLECADDDEDAPRKARIAAWAWLSKLRAEGLKPAENLVAKRAFADGGIHMAANLVVLRAPLAGWMIWAERVKSAITVRLVPPDNRTATVLWKLKTRYACVLFDEEGGCDERAWQSASILEVVLSPDGRLVWTAGLIDGSHCGPLAITRKVTRLPKNLLNQ